VSEKVIAKDRYGNGIRIIKNVGCEGYDLFTDGRVYLSAQLARTLSKRLLAFATKLEGERRTR